MEQNPVRTHGVTHYDPDRCFGCRIKSVSFPANNPTFAPHYNHAVGRWVTSDRDFRDALKQASDANSEATGMEHNYEPRYPGDVASVPYRESDGVLDDRGRAISEAMA